MIDLFYKYGIQVIAFGLAFGLSTLIIQFVIIRPSRKTKKGHEKPKEDKKTRKLGIWIGFFEALIVFVLVANDAFDAMAIIFVAKIYSRRDEIKTEPAYFLLGALTNLSIAIFFAIIAGHLIDLYANIWSNILIN